MSAKDLLVALVVLSVIIIIKSAAFVIIHEKSQMMSYSKKYFSRMDYVFGKINSTTGGMNISFDITRNLLNPIRLLVTVSKFYSNKFIPVPTRFNFNLCEAYKKNVFGIQDFDTHGNFSMCDMKKGSYYVKNYPGVSVIPSYLPFGTYRLAIYLMDGGTEMFSLDWYMKLLPNTAN